MYDTLFNYILMNDVYVKTIGIIINIQHNIFHYKV